MNDVSKLTSNKILIVDDDPKLLAGVRRTLRREFDIDTASNGLEALEALDNHGPYTVIVSDNRMPGIGGFELLKELVFRAPDTIRIMLTGCSDQNTAIEAINEGRIFRFLNKPCSADTLKAAITDAIEEFNLAAERNRLETELQKMAFVDELTGANNRRRFFELGQEEFDRACRFKRPLSVLMVDADHFKSFNDEYGHATGDIVLKNVAASIGGSLREADILGRYGGEEFVAVLVETDHSTAAVVAERVRKAVEQMAINTPNGNLSVTVSIGLATTNSQDGTLTALIERADAALYQAKENGRNRVGVADRFELTI